VGIVKADTFVQEDEPDTNFGSELYVQADLDPGKWIFYRTEVSGVGTQPVVAAWLRLQVADVARAESSSGGRIHSISTCSWDEHAMTWNTRPAIDGTMLDEIGAVERRDVVEADVSAAISGDGTYCFAVDSAIMASVKYGSREGHLDRPALEIVIPGVCGDGVVNDAAEECDGFDDVLCPGMCLADCTCAVCGDNVAESPVEVCDGTDDTQCPGECGLDCTCPSLVPPPFSCLRQGGPLITLRGSLLNTYRNDALVAGTRIDARRATVLGWPGRGDPINLEGSAGVCVAGGTVLGQYDRSFSWDQMHDFNNAGIIFKSNQLIVDGVRIDNVGDGVRPRSSEGFIVRHAWLSYVRDDCVENDHLQAGLVEDSLFDGCYVGFSARPSQGIIDAGYDGSGSLWTIQDSLVRLEPMPQPDGGNPGEFGHGGFFKWDNWDDPATSLSPKLALYNNVFMAEQVGDVGGGRMGTPPGQVMDCANNVMVWLGAGDFPGTLPACFTITTDRNVWDNAVAEWLSRHPQIGR